MEREEGGRWTERKGRKDRGREGRREGDERSKLGVRKERYRKQPRNIDICLLIYDPFPTR